MTPTTTGSPTNTSDPTWIQPIPTSAEIPKIYDVLMICSVGGAPAAYAAAWNLIQWKHSVLLLSNKQHQYAPTDYLNSDNFLSQERLRNAEATRNALGLSQFQFQFQDAEIVGLRKVNENLFEAEDKGGNVYRGLKLILATGRENANPELNAQLSCEGVLVPIFGTVSLKRQFLNFPRDYCGLRNLPFAGIFAIARLANNPRWILDLCRMFGQTVITVTIYTNGNEQLANALAPELEGQNWKIDNREIAYLYLSDYDYPVSSLQPLHGLNSRNRYRFVTHVAFKHGDSFFSFKHVDMVMQSFMAYVPLDRDNRFFKQQLGIELSPEGEIEIDSNNMTSVSGVYAAAKHRGQEYNPSEIGVEAASGVHSVLI